MPQVTHVVIEVESLGFVLTAVSDRIAAMHRAIGRESDAETKSAMRIERDCLIKAQVAVGRAMQ